MDTVSEKAEQIIKEHKEKDEQFDITLLTFRYLEKFCGLKIAGLWKESDNVKTITKQLYRHNKRYKNRRPKKREGLVFGDLKMYKVWKLKDVISRLESQGKELTWNIAMRHCGMNKQEFYDFVKMNQEELELRGLIGKNWVNFKKIYIEDILL